MRHPTLAASIAETLAASGRAGALAALAVCTRLEQPEPLLKALGEFIRTADMDMLRELNSALPRFSAVLATSGAQVAAALASRLRTRARTTKESDLRALARSLTVLAIRLADTSRPTEALAAAQESVDLYRDLVTRNRDGNLASLAWSVINLAVRLGDAGRPTEALTAAEESVDLYRDLVTRNRDSYLPYLSLSVNNLGVRLYRLAA